MNKQLEQQLLQLLRDLPEEMLRSLLKHPQLTEKEARRLIRKFQKVLPTLYPVRFERVPAEEIDHDWGECKRITRRGRKYLLIRIASWLPWPADYIIFAHEYGHARAWKPDKLEIHDTEDHGPEWGIKHAEVWRILP